MIDLRSDTVTRPTPEMLKAMTEAEVGDDVFESDPTVNKFQQKIAALFGMEAGLFVPSGTMSNQLGIKVLTEPGDEILIDEKGHIFNYETSAAPALSGVQVTTLQGKQGKLDRAVLENKVRGNFDWEPRTKVVCIENTTNKGGGVCYSKEELSEIKEFADEHELAVHLDGARIWNAMTATDIKPEYFGTIADTISVCFSKGLGAPVGSMLLSSKMNIAKARRYRKMWGGGMRQVGLLAAAAEYGVDNHWPLLKDDHRRARDVAETIAGCSKLAIDMDNLQTNILIFDVLEEDAVSAVERLQEEGIVMIPFGPKTIRATFYFEIGDEDVKQVKTVLKKLFN
ncbi:threonine aldolase family protein [Gracilimonas sediminicola]|uniref:Aminotransferase class I/II-fold pyridoxal phosphate-dependent enzyme n=1 Tax=Gracilimonas sediminicola TaxID=2952158 RepID=A0A9X2L166_9BACT|nr:GntG family PLP-dependent aldolase [Gracilimonas sediminicola]MCP9290302.1 aminotransferase class I/II-fold pyridoxal phosphate-dependent enzyme [Gracilimonas sediminicola]